MVKAVIAISFWFNINEYLISFFVLAIGTSLSEFVVDLTALMKGQYELVIGDIIGSSLFDACFLIGIGALFFPLKCHMANGVNGLIRNLCVGCCRLDAGTKRESRQKGWSFPTCCSTFNFFLSQNLVRKDAKDI